jgi:hypothetical protein
MVPFVPRRATVASGVALVVVSSMTLAGPSAAAAGPRDVAEGATYTVSARFPDPNYQQTERASYPDDGFELTDGVHASLDFTDPAWVGYLRQVSREVVLDLGEVKTLRSLSTDFLYAPEFGIHLPGTVRYSLSLDGSTWRVAGEAPGDNTGTDVERRTVDVTITPTYARYLKVTFDVNVWAFVDEINAYGTDGIEHGARPPSGPLEPEDQPGDFLPQGVEQVGGVRNVYLAYTYDTRSPNGELGTWRAEDFLPVITHVDDQGTPTDWMFDTVLFMAGGSERDAYPTKAEWDDLLDRLFAPEVNVTALNEATRRATRALGAPGRHRVKVILPIPNPVPDAATPWGTLDGEQLDLNPTRVGEEASLRNRLRVVRWYVDEALRRYQRSQRDRLELVGFYWMRETVIPRSADAELTRQVSTLLHGIRRGTPRTLRFYWIPYYQAPGFQFWRSYGFDASMLQPNFFFDATLPPQDTRRLEQASDLARWSGQGVEIEGDRSMLTDPGARQKFLNYLETFRRTGADRALKAYYWGARDVILGVARSSEPEVRATYDAAYEFIRRP